MRVRLCSFVYKGHKHAAICKNACLFNRAGNARARRLPQYNTVDDNFNKMFYFFVQCKGRAVVFNNGTVNTKTHETFPRQIGKQLGELTFFPLHERRHNKRTARARYASAMPRSSVCVAHARSAIDFSTSARSAITRSVITRAARFCSSAQNAVSYLVGCLLGNYFAAFRAMSNTHARIKKSQIVIYFCGRCNC